MSPNLQSNRAEPLTLARPLALAFGAVVVALAGLAWGLEGTVAAGLGALVSVANVFVLSGLGARARREAAGAELEPGRAERAASRLQLALGAKTLILLALVTFIAQRGPVGPTLTPFTLGLLVTVFALIAAGLVGQPA